MGSTDTLPDLPQYPGSVDCLGHHHLAVYVDPAANLGRLCVSSNCRVSLDLLCRQVID